MLGESEDGTHPAEEAPSWGLLRTTMNFLLQEVWGISWVTEELLALKKKICSGDCVSSRNPGLIKFRKFSFWAVEILWTPPPHTHTHTHARTHTHYPLLTHTNTESQHKPNFLLALLKSPILAKLAVCMYVCMYVSVSKRRSTLSDT